MYPRANMADVSLLQTYIIEQKLEDKGVPLSELRKLDGANRVVLGVDGTKLMDMITQAVRDKEKVAIYTSTTPLTMYQKITDFCDMLASIKNCTPVLVFNGIPFLPDVREDFLRERIPIPPELLTFNGLESSRLCKMQPNKASDIQKKTANRFVIEEDVENQIIRLFRQKIRDTMRAPYLAWAQLSAFCYPTERLLSEVYGCLELLAFPGIDRVITNINPAKGTFDMVRKANILDKLRIDEEDFGSLVMLDTRNKILRPVSLKFMSFDDMCKNISRTNNYTLGTTHALFLEQELLRTSQEGRIIAAHRNLTALACPILKVTPPYCVPLWSLYPTRRAMAPIDTQEVWGAQLPVFFYYMLSSGLVSPSLLAALSQKCVVDDWPLIDSIKFRTMAEKILPLRVEAVSQLYISVNHTDFPGMSWYRRYNLPQGRLCSITQSPGIHLDLWSLNGRHIPEKIYFSDVMEFATMATYDDQIVYVTKEETRAVVLLQVLDLLGYFTHEITPGEPAQKSNSSFFGSALKKCDVGSLSEYVVLLIELARTRAFDSQRIQTSPEGFSQVTVSPPITLASRILSLIPINVSSAWTGPLDPDLAAFSIISRMMSRSLRQLLETMLTSLFFTGQTSFSLQDASQIEESLPFSIPVEFNGGLLAQFILSKRGCTLRDIQANFPECNYLNLDLTTLRYFWGLSVSILKTIVCEKNKHFVEIAVLDEANTLMEKAWSDLGVDEASNDFGY